MAAQRVVVSVATCDEMICEVMTTVAARLEVVVGDGGAVIDRVFHTTDVSPELGSRLFCGRRISLSSGLLRCKFLK